MSSVECENKAQGNYRETNRLSTENRSVTVGKRKGYKMKYLCYDGSNAIGKAEPLTKYTKLITIMKELNNRKLGVSRFKI